MELSKNNSRISEAMRTSILQNARELFSKYGYKKTTMDDISSTLQRGKSSLYYYFKCKEDIFLAVLEGEEDVLFSKLKEVVSAPITAQDKLRQYVLVRMGTIRTLENYHKALKDQLFEGIELFQAMMHKSEKQEIDLLKIIIQEGLDSGEFTLHNVEMAAFGIGTSLKGLEIPLFRGSDTPEEFNIKLENVLNILFYGLVTRK